MIVAFDGIVRPERSVKDGGKGGEQLGGSVAQLRGINNIEGRAVGFNGIEEDFAAADKSSSMP